MGPSHAFCQGLAGSPPGLGGVSSPDPLAPPPRAKWGGLTLPAAILAAGTKQQLGLSMWAPSLSPIFIEDYKVLLPHFITFVKFNM